MPTTDVTWRAVEAAVTKRTKYFCRDRGQLPFKENIRSTRLRDERFVVLRLSTGQWYKCVRSRNRDFHRAHFVRANATSSRKLFVKSEKKRLAQNFRVSLRVAECIYVAASRKRRPLTLSSRQMISVLSEGDVYLQVNSFFCKLCARLKRLVVISS